MNLILLDKKDAVGANEYVVSDHRAAHIRNILGAVVGDRLQVGLIEGPTGTAEVIEIDPSSVRLTIEFGSHVPLPPIEIDLICALPRPQTVKKILRLCGMMSVRRLYFIRANRVEKSFYDSPLLTDDKMRPLLLEGLSQGKFTRMPEISIERQFRPFVEDRLSRLYADMNHPYRILPEQSATDNLSKTLYGTNDFPKEILLAIGPEGGWVDFELELFAQQAFRKFSLGPWTLRVENAVTAAMAQIELCRSIRS